MLSGDANLVVNTTEDGINPFDDVVTLRDAMAYATSVGGKVNITFSDAVDWSANKVIVLTMGKELGLWQTPMYNKKKIYQVTLNKELTEEDMATISAGIDLEDGPIKPDEVSYVDEADRSSSYYTLGEST